MNDSTRTTRYRFVGALLLATLFGLPSLALASADGASPQPVLTASSSPAIQSTSQRVRASAPRGIRESFYTCIDRPQNLASTATCITEERTYQDARLNKAYKQLLQRLDADAKTSLISSERAWLASRGEDEKFEASLYEDDALGDIEQEQNDTFRICQRANTLERYLGLIKLDKK